MLFSVIWISKRVKLIHFFVLYYIIDGNILFIVTRFCVTFFVTIFIDKNFLRNDTTKEVVQRRTSCHGIDRVVKILKREKWRPINFARLSRSLK